MINWRRPATTAELVIGLVIACGLTAVLIVNIVSFANYNNSLWS